MSFCLPKFAADAFLGKLRTGEINPKQLAEMTSADRRNYFSSIIGEENAKQVNALFESKLLLKNQQLGMINWAKKVAGLKEEVRRDMLTKISKLSTVLEPKDLNMFLEDLASQRLGMDVSVEEAGTITHLAKDVEEFKSKADAQGKFPTEEDRMNYGLSLVKFKNFVSELKSEANKKTTKEMLLSPVSTIGNLSKSIVASFDNSFIGRQGIKTLFNAPDLWMKHIISSWKTFAKQLAAKNEGGLFSNQENAVMDLIKADIYSRPNAVNGLYDRMNLAIGLKTEEAFPSSAPGRIPLLGRLFHASETAYNGTALRLRADWADRYAKLAEKQGINLLDKTQAQDIGNLVNSLTGRGKLPYITTKGADVINATFFSPRYLKSNWDILTGHSFGTELETSFARKQAAINTLRTVGGMAATLYVIDKLWPGSIDWKKKVGRIKLGSNYVDISGGAYGFLQAAFDVAERIKNQTGKYGEKTGWDVITNFFSGRLSPVAGAVRDVAKGKNYQGQKPTVTNVAGNLLVPLPVQTYEQINKSKDGDTVLQYMLQFLDVQGLSVQTPLK